MKRAVIIVVILLVAVGAAAPFLPFDFLKPRIAGALSAGLGRRVEIDSVYLTLFSGPGFSLEGVTIHEDPRVGREPFAYAATLDVRVDLFGLLAGRRGFSLLNFGDATFNLVKNGDAPWNVQMLLDSQRGRTQIPAIRIRAGRVNVKFGDTKSVLFFNDVDLDVAPARSDIVSVRFSGVPSRTDRSMQDLGHFFVRGTYAIAGEVPVVDMTAQMEPSALSALGSLLGQSRFDWQGSASGDARISGPLAALTVTGTARLTDSRQAELVAFGYKGIVDVGHQKIELATDPAKTTKVRYAVENLLTYPKWEVSATFDTVSLADLTALLRKTGVPLPEKLTAKGSLEGAAAYSSTAGFSGQLDLQKGSVSFADSGAADLSAVHVILAPQTITLQPVTVTQDGAEVARVEGAYSFAPPNPKNPRIMPGLDLRITARGLPTSALAAMGFTGIPLPEGFSKGTVRGTARYREGYWSGDYDLQAGTFPVDGLADPVNITALNVHAAADKVTFGHIKGSVGKFSFEGEYHRVAPPAKADQVRLVISGGSGQELERLFRPTLARGGGFIQRTLRLGGETAEPDWLGQRKMEGTLAVRGMNVAGHMLAIESARLIWTGSLVSLTGMNARIDSVRSNGDLRVDLSSAAPTYRFEGTLLGVPIQGGQVDLEGNGRASGVGAALLGSLHGEGSFSVKSIALSPDAEFRAGTGKFTVDISGGSPRWKFNDVELTRGGETFLGEGSAAGDGKLTLDLTSDGKPVKVTGSLTATTRAAER
jgi:hypothetical protein